MSGRVGPIWHGSSTRAGWVRLVWLVGLVPIRCGMSMWSGTAWPDMSFRLKFH